MRPNVDPAPARRSTPAAFLLAGLLAAACGSGGPSPAAAASASPMPSTSASAAVTEAPSQPVASSAAPSVAASPSASTAVASAAASQGPATASVAVTGTSGLTGSVTPTEIICGEPSFNGPQIFVLATAAGGSPQVVLFITANHLEARVGTGSGTSLRLRTFAGTGVSGFDATTGAHLDGPLTETTPSGSAKGALGAITAVSGSIDCGNQQPGSATVVVSGTTPLGVLAPGLTSVHVMCTLAGGQQYVGIQALGTAGTTPVLVFVTLGPKAVQVAVETPTVGSFFSANGTTLATVTATGGTVNADVTETDKNSAVHHVLHVAGDATCGAAVGS
jgi:hypothetical protein